MCSHTKAYISTSASASERATSLFAAGAPRSRLYLHSRVGFATLYAQRRASARIHTCTNRGEQLFAFSVLIRCRRCDRGVALRFRRDRDDCGKSAMSLRGACASCCPPRRDRRRRRRRPSPLTREMFPCVRLERNLFQTMYRSSNCVTYWTPWIAKRILSNEIMIVSE